MTRRATCNVTAGRNQYSDPKQLETQVIHSCYLKSDDANRKPRTAQGICSRRVDVLRSRVPQSSRFWWLSCEVRSDQWIVLKVPRTCDSYTKHTNTLHWETHRSLTLRQVIMYIVIHKCTNMHRVTFL